MARSIDWNSTSARKRNFHCNRTGPPRLIEGRYERHGQGQDHPSPSGQATLLASPAETTGEIETRAYLYGAKAPLHLRHALAKGAMLRVSEASNDVIG